MVIRRSRGHVRDRAHPLPTPVGGTDETRRLAVFLVTLLQPPGTDEPWIATREVAKRASRQRKYSVQEVNASLRGDTVPVPDIINSIIALRVEQGGGRDSSRSQRMWHNQAEELNKQAVRSLLATRDGHPAPNHHRSTSLRKGLRWAAGLAGATVITILVSTVLPTVLSEEFNTSRIEDAIRQGPDIITSESMYYPDGTGVPFPTVVPRHYSPPLELVQALSRPGAAASLAVQKQVREADGVDVRDIFIRIIVQGNRNELIRILNISLVNLRRTAPLDNVLFDIYGQGEDSNIQMGFNLDQPFPQALNVTEPDLVTSEPFFEAHTISLANREQAVIVIQASTQCYSASFDLAVNYTIGGVVRTEIISNAGKPFQVSAYHFTRGGLMSYREVYELQGNFSVVRLNHQGLMQFRNYFMQGVEACPYISSSG
jgi:hypothetical protein